MKSFKKYFFYLTTAIPIIELNTLFTFGKTVFVKDTDLKLLLLIASIARAVSFLILVIGIGNLVVSFIDLDGTKKYMAFKYIKWGIIIYGMALITKNILIPMLISL